MTPTFGEGLLIAGLVVGLFLGGLVLIAAPIEHMARRSPAFAEKVDRFIDRIL